MKRVPFVFVLLPLLALGACQRQAAAPPAQAALTATPPATAAEAPTPVASPATAEATASPVPPREVAPPPAAPAPARAAAPEREVSPVSGEPAAAPRPAPKPTPAPVVVAAGTSLPIVFETTVASNTSRAEDSVTASLAEDVTVGGTVVLPAGTEVRGFVTAAQGSGRVKGRARLAVRFTEIRSPGRTYPIQASSIDVTAASSKGRDAKIAGGAAAAGAVIGAIADGGEGALKGGLIGGAAGGAAVLATKGKEVVFASGSRATIKLQQDLRIR